MNRRQLLQAAGGAGLYLSLANRARAQNPGPKDVFWVHLQANGGWDPGLFCDPKVNLRASQIAAKVGYFRNDVANVKTTSPQGINYLGFADFELPADQGFFAKYGRNLLVINGVDCKTIDHNLGERYNCTGSTNGDFPSIAATIAVANGQGRLLAFLDMAGFSFAANEIAPARLADNGAAWISRFVNPNSVTGRGAATYTRPESVALVRQAQERRLARLIEHTNLIGRRDAEEKYLSLRKGLDQLGTLDIASLSGDLRTSDMVFVKQAEGTVPMAERYRYPQLVDYRRFQIELGLEAFKKRLASAMTIAIKGFDTHSDNEQGQAPSLRSVMGFASYTFSRASTLGIPIAILMTSDFGRSPKREGNADTGTGHWPVGAVMMLFNDAARSILKVRTGEVLGGTTDQLIPRKIHPTTFALDPAMGGVVLSPGHVMRAVRVLAGIDKHPIAAKYDLRVDADIDLRVA